MHHHIDMFAKMPPSLKTKWDVPTMREECKEEWESEREKM